MRMCDVWKHLQKENRNCLVKIKTKTAVKLGKKNRMEYESISEKIEVTY